MHPLLISLIDFPAPLLTISPECVTQRQDLLACRSKRMEVALNLLFNLDVINCRILEQITSERVQGQITYLHVIILSDTKSTELLIMELQSWMQFSTHYCATWLKSVAETLV